jgi:uncharacterized membrane protein
MVWNVYFHIIPGQRRMVEAIRAGRDPNLRDGAIGKQRSVHNTYFTLPVLFTMISNHFPMTFGHRYAWAVLAVIMLAGALIRQYFVLRHSGRNALALPAAAALLLVGLVIWLAPARGPASAAANEVTFAEVRPIIAERCATCHAQKPSFAGFQQPPAGVMLDTPERIHAAAPRIQQQAVNTQAMPLGNLTHMTDEERSRVARWLARGAPLD